MNALIVVCHPLPDSLNASLAHAIQTRLEREQHEVELVDLYRSNLDPVLSSEELQRRFSFDGNVQHYIQLVRNAHLLVFVHPDWWGGMPSLLHGFIERVFRPGVAYSYDGPEFGEKSHVPLLTEKAATTFVTSDQKEPRGGHPLSSVWERHIFAFTGVRSSGCHFLFDVRHTRYRDRSRWITRAGEICSSALQCEDRNS